jgi:hypothetical protein
LFRSQSRASVLSGRKTAHLGHAHDLIYPLHLAGEISSEPPSDETT